MIEYTLKYTSERHQFNKPLILSTDQQKLADMATKIFVGEAMNWRTIGAR